MESFGCPRWPETYYKPSILSIAKGLFTKIFIRGTSLSLGLVTRMVATKDPTYSYKVGDLGITREESNIDIENTLLAQWMLPPEALDSDEFGPIGRAIDVYHIGLVLLSVLLGYEPSFTKDRSWQLNPERSQSKCPQCMHLSLLLLCDATRRFGLVLPSCGITLST